ncbi:MAG: DUF2283 domain-containing protein [Candidatus Erginobacter occultus]|nr:DUF2283 domain-containing protein [Candidatus Erginobacter occultus]
MGCIPLKDGFKMISIDNEAGAIYIQVTNNKIQKTLEIDDNVFVDVDAKGKLVGVELIRIAQVEIPGIFEAIAKKIKDPSVADYPQEISRELSPLCQLQPV